MGRIFRQVRRVRTRVSVSGPRQGRKAEPFSQVRATFCPMSAIAKWAIGQAAEGTDDDWIAAMRAGEFGRAWAITDRDLARYRQTRDEKHSGPRHLQRIWRGEELRSRRVLVRCYHGLGYTIQFARFLQPLAALTRELSVWCQPEVLSLIERVEGVDRAI